MKSLLAPTKPSLTTTNKNSSKSIHKAPPFEEREIDLMESSPLCPGKTNPKTSRNQPPLYPPGLTYPLIPPGFGQYFASLANFNLYLIFSAQQVQAGLFSFPIIHHSNPVISQISSRTKTTDPSLNQSQPVDETTSTSQTSEKQCIEGIR